MQNPKRENFATRSCPHGHYCSLALGQFLSSAEAAGHSDPLCHVWSIRSSQVAAGSPRARARARGGLRAGQEERCKQTENSGEPLALVQLGLLRLSHTACSRQQQETSLPGQAWERIIQKNSELIVECQPRLCFQIIQHIEKIALLSSSCPSPTVTLVHNYGCNYDQNHFTVLFYSVVL